MERRKCPRCNGSGSILWPDPDSNIELDTALIMVKSLRDEMYNDLLSHKIIDDSIPKEHLAPEHLWRLAKARILKHSNKSV